MAIDRGDDVRPGAEPTDSELLELFRARPERAWPRFLDRHAETMLGHLRRLGFRGDELMDRFVYVCEKLAEDRCRRLRTVRFAGRDGDLDPWLRTVVGRLAVSWAWSVEGRRRLLKPIERLGTLEQRVFALHFWHGLPPAAIEERLRAEHRPVGLIEVLDALARVLDALGPAKLWRLAAGLARRRRPRPIGTGSDDEPAFEPPTGGDDAEAALLRAEAEARLDRVLAHLAPRPRLIVQLRYEEGLTFKEIGTVIGVSARAARSAHDRTLDDLRRRLAADTVVSVES